MERKIEVPSPGKKAGQPESQAASFNVHRHEMIADSLRESTPQGTSMPIEGKGKESVGEALFVKWQRIRPPARRGGGRDSNSRNLLYGDFGEINIKDVIFSEEGKNERESPYKEIRKLDVYLLEPGTVASVKDDMFADIETLKPDGDDQEKLKLVKKNMETIYDFHCTLVNKGTQELTDAWVSIQKGIESLEGVNLHAYLDRLLHDTDEQRPEVREKKAQIASVHYKQTSSEQLGSHDTPLETATYDSIRNIKVGNFEPALKMLETSCSDKIDVAAKDVHDNPSAAKDVHDNPSATKSVLENIRTVYSYIEQFPGDKLLQEGGYRPGNAVSLWHDTFCVVLASHPESTISRAWNKLYEGTEGTEGTDMQFPEEYTALKKIQALGVENIDESIGYITSKYMLLSLKMRALRTLVNRRNDPNNNIFGRAECLIELGEAAATQKVLGEVKKSLQALKSNYFDLPIDSRVRKMSAAAASWKALALTFKQKGEILSDVRDELQWHKYEPDESESEEYESDESEESEPDKSESEEYESNNDN